MSVTLSSKNALVLAFLAGAGALAGASIFAFIRNRAHNHSRLRAPAAAFAAEGVHPDSFDQTRDAGPDHMRDEDGSDWDALDQTSDESFPSSDPPVANDFRTPAPIAYPETS